MWLAGGDPITLKIIGLSGVYFLHFQAPFEWLILKSPTRQSKQMSSDSDSAIHSSIFSIGPWDAWRLISLHLFLLFLQVVSGFAPSTADSLSKSDQYI